MGRGHVTVLKLGALGDLLFSIGKFSYEQKMQSMGKNKHMPKWQLLASCSYTSVSRAPPPELLDICLRKPGLQRDRRGILGGTRRA